MFQRQSLARCIELGVGLEFRLRADVMQGVEEAAVAQVDLWRFPHTLAEILRPRRQIPNHERPGQDLEVALGSLVVDAKGAGDFRGVPRLPVRVGNHDPTTTQLLRRDGDAELRDVTSEKVRMNCCRQWKLASSEALRKDSGNPPRSVDQMAILIGEARTMMQNVPQQRAEQTRLLQQIDQGIKPG